MSSVPVAFFGLQPDLSQKIQEALEPEYDGKCATVEKELVPLLQGGKSVAPSSTLGSNAGRAAADRKVPAIVFFAGAISPEDVSKVTVIVKRVAPAVHLVQATREEVRQAGATGPDPAIIAKVLKQKFTEALKA
ncbi:unnamed protein product [Parascedosporium putredinis]|uniref:Uncharacterized protein n=1 Tax=Parascedosporium putredinis TaxID=1442378 RepID=A0A9P1GU20_9PEZI|nr:unnamed protein product [Parascedosporium putredinis]CAI7987333.1 unnamed protein product [Parascedosporium putredinis]